MNARPIEIKSMHGLGDNIFIRPFIKKLAAQQPVFIDTPWPELFEDIGNVFFLTPQSRLRTQRKNIERTRRSYVARSSLISETRQLQYGDLSIKKFGGIVRAIEAMLPVNPGEPFEFDLPPAMRRRYRTATAIIRPVTTRKEWTNTARSPKPEYIAQIAERLMATHEVIVIADLQDGEEWLDGPLPPCDRAYIKGELNVVEMLRLVSEASVVVGGIGWLVPAAIAAKTNAFIICGGQGAHNAPSVVTDQRMDLSRIAFATPDNYCGCNQMRHDCNKTISNLTEQWDAFGEQVKGSTR